MLSVKSKWGFLVSFGINREAQSIKMLLAHTHTAHIGTCTLTPSLFYIYIYIYVLLSTLFWLCIVAENTDGFRYRFTHMHINISILTYLDLSKHWGRFSAYCNYIKLQFDHLCIFKVHKILFHREVRNAHHWYLNAISIPNNISIHISLEHTHMHTYRAHTCTHAHRVCDLGFKWSSIFVTL